MTSHPGEQTIAIRISPNISRSKGNQTIKFVHLIEYNKKIFFFKNYGENEAERLVPDLFLFFKKALYEVKASGLQLTFKKFRWPSTWHPMKTTV